MQPPCDYLLAKEWAGLCQRITLPAHLDLDSYRRVFFAGAATFYHLMLTSADPQATIHSLKAELLEFAEVVRQQEATK